MHSSSRQSSSLRESMLHNLAQQSPNLLLDWFSSCFMFLVDMSLLWVSSLSPSTIVFFEHLLSSIGNMASKRARSKDIVRSSTRDVVEQVSMSLLVYIETHMFIEKDIKITWQDINTIFTGNFEENLEDWQVYVNIHKSRLYKVACKYHTFLCTDVIHWIISHTDPETMILINVSGVEIPTFRT